MSLDRLEPIAGRAGGRSVLCAPHVVEREGAVFLRAGGAAPVLEGETLDPARMAKLMNSGNTIDDWKAATKEDK